ncbi:MAG: MBL fold metallo-hydrolase, partial [bacterium]|nr:MBL fold metallo-hydrolase [bacterium]
CFGPVLLVFILIWSVTASAPLQGNESTFKVMEVSASVVMLKAAYGSNVTCIALDDGLYFVDAGLNTLEAAGFRKQMEERFKKKTVALLLTHGHSDHIFGMGAFKDVPVIAASIGKALLESQMKSTFDERKIKMYTGIFPQFKECFTDAETRMPTRWFDVRLTFGIKEKGIVFTRTEGHTNCSSSVYFAAEKVLVAGDLVQVDQYPYFGDRTNDMAKWLAAFDKWLKLPIAKVCPGHGVVTDTGYIKKMADYFKALAVSLKQLKKKGLPVKEVVRHADLPKGYWGDVPRPRWFDYCIGSYYNTL